MIGFTAAALLVFLTFPASGRAQEPPPSPQTDLSSECDYGITLAFAGQVERAEEVFTSLLSHSPGDARALNNLGNLYVLRGELKVAAAFYDRAAEVEAGDPGILLNRATVFMMGGDRNRAEAEAARAITMAGGTAKAASLLGLRAEKDSTSKAADETKMARIEMLNLLHQALEAVPQDSTAAVDSSAVDSTGDRRKRGTWRNAGSRASDGESMPILYWKR